LKAKYKPKNTKPIPLTVAGFGGLRIYAHKKNRAEMRRERKKRKFSALQNAPT
jgi:hypothetical protein